MHNFHLHIVPHLDEPAKPRRGAPERLTIRPAGLLILPGVIVPQTRPPDPKPAPVGPTLAQRLRRLTRAPA